MAKLKLYLLGPPNIELDGSPVQIQRHKAMVLLAYLALNPESQARSTLAALLWPEVSHQASRSDLRRDLSLLIKALGGSWFACQRETISVKGRAELWTDVDELKNGLALAVEQDPGSNLDQLSRLAGLYRGDFLAGLTLPDCPDFDDWQFFLTEGLRQSYEKVLDLLVQGHTARRDLAGAIEWARRWLALNRLHEPVHFKLMWLFASTGQRAAALRQYEVCERILKEEFNLSPSPETTSLYAEIRAGKFNPASAPV